MGMENGGIIINEKGNVRIPIINSIIPATMTGRNNTPFMNVRRDTIYIYKLYLKYGEIFSIRRSFWFRSFSTSAGVVGFFNMTHYF